MASVNNNSKNNSNLKDGQRVYQMGKPYPNKAVVVVENEENYRVFYVYENYGMKSETLWAKIKDFGRDVAWQSARSMVRVINEAPVDPNFVRSTKKNNNQVHITIEAN